MTDLAPRLPHVASRLFNVPLAIEPHKLHLIAAVLAPRLGLTLLGLPDPGLAPAMLTRREKGDAPPYAVVNNKAVVPVFGTLVQRAGALDAESGLVSYERLRQVLEQATADPAVRETVLHIDSGGGEAAGLVDFLAVMRALGERKPMTAFTDSMAASAAYGIFSAARSRVASRDAILGSIGVRMLHVDQTGFNEQRGVKVTEIFAGARKVDLSPHEALNPEKRAALESIVTAFYDVFTNAVATNLGETQQFVMNTEAGLFVGIEAVNARLAQRLGTLDDVLQPQPARSQTGHAKQERRRLPMAQECTTVAELEAAYPELCAELRATAAASGKASAEQAERERIKEIFSLVPVGAEAIAQECAFVTPVSSGEAAKKWSAELRTQGSQTLAQLRADAPAPVRAGDPEPSARSADTLSATQQADNDARAKSRAALRAVR